MRVFSQKIQQVFRQNLGEAFSQVYTIIKMLMFHLHLLKKYDVMNLLTWNHFLYAGGYFVKDFVNGFSFLKILITLLIQKIQFCF